MIKIKLDKNFVISSDRRQWILKEYSGKKVVHWNYYSNLNDLIQNYFDMVLRSSNAKGIKELLLAQKNAVNHIKNLLEPLEYQITLKKNEDDNFEYYQI
jgi:hypothetical protein|tara:strand:- start:23814 stop:24110 length:297 start_codon:yes stop_codon:yes gene_type:complete